MTGKQGQPEPLESRVLRFIREHNLLANQSRLLVGVSGGQDSVCLLHVMAKLRAELGINLHLAHLNHQLRGAESDADAAYVADLARKLGILATIEKRDVSIYQRQHRLSPEEAAREVRYAFFSDVAEFLGTDRVAVAHTDDDHIETMLMHLIRGTGTRGLRGLQPISLWRSGAKTIFVIRPLLRVSRQETAAYCQDHNLVPRIDMTNLSLSPFRNRIRLELLPLLRKYNPGVDHALLRTSRLAGESLAFLDEECTRIWDKVIERQNRTILLDKKEFLSLSSVLQRHLLRMAVEAILGSLKDIEARHIEGIMSLLAKPAGKRLNLPAGLTFSIDYEHYLLSLEPMTLCPFPPLGEEAVLNVPGETRLPGWRVTTAITGREDIALKENKFKAYLDLDKTGKTLTVRSRRPGDRFQPLGLGQPKKLGRFMIDARIPQSWRERIPIVASPQNVLWVTGWRIDERFRITEHTRRVLSIIFERTSA
ncbi:MAG: tRNA lysidine(34) synthetase TilS [Chloroflexi bacterium]|nr:tRNA lysidine(34) synthetase TilS [Chloroflexota bacterium]